MLFPRQASFWWGILHVEILFMSYCTDPDTAVLVITCRALSAAAPASKLLEISVSVPKMQQCSR